MFRGDKLTVKRENYTIVNGEVVYLEPVIIAMDVPCHLSISLNNSAKLNGAPYIASDFTLFLNSNLKVNVKENDILLITSDKFQEYKLYAGEVKIYNLTTQIKCRQEKIIESWKWL